MIFIALALVLFALSCIGILLSRKYKFIEIYTSKSHTILFALILSILVFSWRIEQNGSIAGSIGYVIGYIYAFSIPVSLSAVYLFNKSITNSKDFFHAFFFSLIIIFIFILDTI